MSIFHLNEGFHKIFPWPAVDHLWTITEPSLAKYGRHRIALAIDGPLGLSWIGQFRVDNFDQTWQSCYISSGPLHTLKDEDNIILLRKKKTVMTSYHFPNWETISPNENIFCSVFVAFEDFFLGFSVKFSFFFTKNFHGIKRHHQNGFFRSFWHFFHFSIELPGRNFVFFGFVISSILSYILSHLYLWNDCGKRFFCLGHFNS